MDRSTENKGGSTSEGDIKRAKQGCAESDWESVLKKHKSSSISTEEIRSIWYVHSCDIESSDSVKNTIRFRLQCKQYGYDERA